MSHSSQDQNQASKSTLKSIVWPARWLQHPECVSQHDRERKFQIEAAFGFTFPGGLQCTFRQSPIFREQSFVPFLESPPMSRLTPCKVALFNVWPWDREAVVPACPPLYCHSSTSVRRLQLEMSQICSTCHIGSATVGNTSSKFCVKDVLFRCVSLGTRLCAIGDVLTHSCALERCSWCLLTFEAFHKDFSFSRDLCLFILTVPHLIDYLWSLSHCLEFRPVLEFYFLHSSSLDALTPLPETWLPFVALRIAAYGTGDATKTDEFSEKFQTAFEPSPPPSWKWNENHVALFRCASIS